MQPRAPRRNPATASVTITNWPTRRIASNHHSTNTSGRRAACGDDPGDDDPGRVVTPSSVCAMDTVCGRGDDSSDASVNDSRATPGSMTSDARWDTSPWRATRRLQRLAAVPGRASSPCGLCGSKDVSCEWLRCVSGCARNRSMSSMSSCSPGMTSSGHARDGVMRADGDGRGNDVYDGDTGAEAYWERGRAGCGGQAGERGDTGREEAGVWGDILCGVVCGVCGKCDGDVCDVSMCGECGDRGRCVDGGVCGSSEMRGERGEGRSSPDGRPSQSKFHVLYCEMLGKIVLFDVCVCVLERKKLGT